MKPIISTILLGVTIALCAPAIIEADTEVPLPSPKIQYMILAGSISAQYNVPMPLLKAVVACESSWNTKAKHITSREQSYGLSQINLLAHPEISIAQAEDPQFSLTYLAKGLSTNPNAWSCYRVVKSKHAK
jgi:soluble lytic murein transglycosylase-like protein